MHDHPRGSGCPECSEEMAAVMRMDTPTYARYLQAKRKGATRMLRAGIKFVEAEDQESWQECFVRREMERLKAFSEKQQREAREKRAMAAWLRPPDPYKLALEKNLLAEPTKANRSEGEPPWPVANLGRSDAPDGYAIALARRQK